MPDIEVGFPSDERIRYIIDTMAVYVMQDGCPFEQAVMLKEQNNPEFRFLFDLKTPEHVYYRWRLYALANEDSLRSWRVEPFLMVEETARQVWHLHQRQGALFVISNVAIGRFGSTVRLC